MKPAPRGGIFAIGDTLTHPKNLSDSNSGRARAGFLKFRKRVKRRPHSDHRKQILSSILVVSTLLGVVALFMSPIHDVNAIPGVGKYSTPYVSTNGHFTLDGLVPVRPIDAYDTVGTIPGLGGTACPDEIVMWIHGFWNDPSYPAFALANPYEIFYTAAQSVKAHGYAYPLIGFAWDSAYLIWPHVEALADLNGIKLAHFFIDYKNQCPLTLLRVVAHSLGARVLLSTLSYMSSNDESPSNIYKLKSVHLVGAAVDRQVVSTDDWDCVIHFTPCYGKVIESQVIEFHNLYNPHDRVLENIYPAMRFLYYKDFARALGYLGSADGISPPRNYFDANVGVLMRCCNDFKSSHLEYRGKIDDNGVLVHTGVMGMVVQDWILDRPPTVIAGRTEPTLDGFTTNLKQPVTSSLEMATLNGNVMSDPLITSWVKTPVNVAATADITGVFVEVIYESALGYRSSLFREIRLPVRSGPLLNVTQDFAYNLPSDTPTGRYLFRVRAETIHDSSFPIEAGRLMIFNRDHDLPPSKFSLASSQSSIVISGNVSTNSTTIALRSQNGFAGLVRLSAYISPPGPTAPIISLNQSSATLSRDSSSMTLLTVEVTKPTTVGSYSVVVTSAWLIGSSPSSYPWTWNVSEASVIISLDLRPRPAPLAKDFHISADPAILSFDSSCPDSSRGYPCPLRQSTITITPLNGFSGRVDLAPVTTPAGGLNVTCSAMTITGPPTGDWTSNCSFRGSTAGNYRVTFVGISCPERPIQCFPLTVALVHWANVTVRVTDFDIQADPSSVTLIKGSSSNSTVTLSGVNGFVGPVRIVTSVSRAVCVNPLQGYCVSTPSANFRSSGSPVTSATFTKEFETIDLVLTLFAETAQFRGRYLVAVNGTWTSPCPLIRCPSISHLALIVVDVQGPPDFGITAYQSSLSVPVGIQGSTGIFVTSIDGFRGNVSLLTFVRPSAGLSMTCYPVAFAGLGASGCGFSSSKVGNYTISFVGSSFPPVCPTFPVACVPQLSHSTNITVQVTDFRVQVEKSDISLPLAASSSEVLSVQPMNGFVGRITVSSSVDPSLGVSVDCTPSVLDNASVRANCQFSGQKIGDYSVTLTGTWSTTQCPPSPSTCPSVSRSANVTVHVASAPMSSSLPLPLIVGLPIGVVVSVSALLLLRRRRRYRD